VRRVVLTDLDGTLLDAHTYDWSPARPALDALIRAHIPLVICTSKTSAEVERLRRALGHRDPFIVENGGSLYVPRGYFEAHGRNGATPQASADATHEDYDVVELGLPYETLVASLREAACAAGVQVRSWADMDEEEVARRCELSIDEARLAMAREHDEPFVIESTEAGSAERLRVEIERRGVRLTRGDRFFHVIGDHDKGTATTAIVHVCRQAWGPIETAAIGDAANDVPMLKAVDHAIVIASPQAASVASRVPGAFLTRTPGPAGWNDAVLEWLAS
jgi:mannosyl-3-phosphoglycerate phosphatase family protein